MGKGSHALWPKATSGGLWKSAQAHAWQFSSSLDQTPGTYLILKATCKKLNLSASNYLEK